MDGKITSPFPMTDEVKKSLEKISEAATARIGAVLSQYLDYEEDTVSVAWTVQKPTAGQNPNDHIMRVFARARKAGLFFEILMDSESGDIKTALIPPTDKDTIEVVSQLFEPKKDQGSFVQHSSGTEYKN